MTHAYRPKGDSLVLNQQIQADRDRVRCTCGHRNVSHGYPDMPHESDIAYGAWPDGSQIGMGACGFDSCDCPTFRDATRGNA